MGLTMPGLALAGDDSDGGSGRSPVAPFTCLPACPYFRDLRQVVDHDPQPTHRPRDEGKILLLL
jgi:hypothetical protein